VTEQDMAWVLVGHYYYNSHDKMMKGKMVTGQEYGMGIGGCNRLCSVATGHGLVASFSPVHVD
jgi:hypothetical protein